MRNPRLKVAIRLQDAVSITRWWSVPPPVKTTEDASLQAASSLMSYWKIWLAGMVQGNKDWSMPLANEVRIR